MITLSPRLVGAGIAAAALVAALAFHFVTVGNLEGDVKKLKDDAILMKSKNDVLTATNTLLTSENASCAKSVSDQNSAIQAARLEESKRAAVASLAVADANRRARSAEAVAAAILARPMPKPGDACGSLDVLLDEELERRAK